MKRQRSKTGHSRRRRAFPNPRTRLQIRDTIRKLKLVLFGIASPLEIESWDRFGRAQHEKYGHLGLRYVPVETMPGAIDDLFARFNFQTGQRLLEIGPGPHGGLSLIAALMGLDVVMVEYDKPFVIDVDRLKAELAPALGAESSLARLSHLSGSIEVDPIDRLQRVLQPYQALVAAAGGAFTIVPGDFADPATQQAAAQCGAIDHVICTDVVSPMSDSFNATTAALTTGDDAKARAILAGLADAAIEAGTLHTAFIVPEQAEACSERIARSYLALESGLRRIGRTLRYEETISPSSGTVLRSRLYHLT
jgi:hypothetical protein